MQSLCSNPRVLQLAGIIDEHINSEAMDLPLRGNGCYQHFCAVPAIFCPFASDRYQLASAGAFVKEWLFDQVTQQRLCLCCCCGYSLHRSKFTCALKYTDDAAYD